MYLIYTTIYIITLIFLFPFEYLRQSKNLRKRWLKERLGFIKFSSPPKYNTTFIWIHAVTIGEVMAAVPFIKRLKNRYQSFEIVVSTVTDSSYKIAKDRVSDFAKVIYMPFDLPFSIRNCLKHFRPSLFIIIETQLYPNLIRILRKYNIPIVLMSGRISERFYNNYKRWKFFLKNVLKDVSLFCMQNESYAEMIKELGANHNKVKIISNFKYDVEPSSPTPEWIKIFKGPVIIGGSTHRTEEDLIIDAYIKLRNDFPQLNLILAPRYPSRFKEVEEVLKKKRLKYLKRSENSLEFRVQSSEFEEETKNITYNSSLIIILDVIGELASVYGISDIAIMGGSFISTHGGHNPLEPAYWGNAIICGPHMENFPFIDDFYRNGGAIRVKPDELYSALKDLISSTEKIFSMGKRAKDSYEKNSGATDRAMEIIEKYLPKNILKDITTIELS